MIIPGWQQARLALAASTHTSLVSALLPVVHIIESQEQVTYGVGGA